MKEILELKIIFMKCIHIYGDRIGPIALTKRLREISMKLHFCVVGSIECDT